MKGMKWVRMLMKGKPKKQPKPKKKEYRSFGAFLLAGVIWLLLDLLESRWKNDLWSPGR